MELTATSVDVRLPATLSQGSLAALAADLGQAFASPLPVVCLRGATDEVFCKGRMIFGSFTPKFRGKKSPECVMWLSMTMTELTITSSGKSLLNLHLA